MDKSNLKYEYRAATFDDLDSIWDKNIADNFGDMRWVKWKSETIRSNREGKSKTFVIVCDNKPIGEGTLLFSPESEAINGRTKLADNKSIVNINALRNDKAHEKKGHMSKLIMLMEQYAIDEGYSTATIGVEAKESRNLAIYLHWGYDTFVMSEIEEGELVLYYSKQLKSIVPSI